MALTRRDEIAGLRGAVAEVLAALKERLAVIKLTQSPVDRRRQIVRSRSAAAFISAGA
jgi:hypothetical protein